MDFSVLISIYFKEKPEFFDSALESLENQTVKASEWVIVQDGPIGQELIDVIDKYKKRGNNIVDVILEKNMGLGLALANGIVHCSYDIVARMDSDDICRNDRFEKEIPFLINNELDACSSHILEFEEDPSKIISARRVPLDHDAIVKYQKKRSALNHVAVIFKKSSVLKAGNYKDCPLMEDDMLWTDMILSGAKLGNIDDYLVYVRTNSSMIARRGGLSYYKKYKKARKMIRKTKFISWWDYKKTCIIQFIVCIMPSRLRKFVFFKMLHSKEKL